jgi:PAS domain S-box-containing protein
MDYSRPRRRKRFLWLKASPIYDRAGAVSGPSKPSGTLRSRKGRKPSYRIEKARMEELFEGSPEAIALADPGTGPPDQPAFHEALRLHLRRGRRAGPWTNIIVPPELPEEAAELTRLVAGGTPLSVETVRQTKNGVPVQVSILATPIRIDEDQIGIYAIYRDISERKRIETALRESEERYRTIIETIEDGYYETDLHGRISFANDSLLRILACPREELIGTSFRAFADRESAQRLWLACRKVFDTGAPCMGLEWVITRKGGEVRSLEISISLIRDARETPTGFRGILRDITERIRSEETIRKLAYHDALKGLPNRFSFTDRLSMAWPAPHGREPRWRHHAGPGQVQGSERLPGAHRGGPSPQGRVGTACAHHAQGRHGRPDGRGRVHDHRHGHQEHRRGGRRGEEDRRGRPISFDCDGRRLSITTSLGIALFSEHGTNPETLVQRADIAMYRAKHLGRDRWKFYEED